MTYYCDLKRHLVCKPYSKENLHKMAESLEIKKCWFHGGRLAHYDIPKKRIDEIKNKCTVIDTYKILSIIKEL